MTEQKCFVFRFADFEVREREFSVIRAGEPLQLEPKAFLVLQYLLHHPQELVTKDELLDAVWKDVAVTENSPARAVAQLRRVLGDDVREPRFIATVMTAGYRFVCPVKASEDGFFGVHGSDTSSDRNCDGIAGVEAKLDRTETTPTPSAPSDDEIEGELRSFSKPPAGGLRPRRRSWLALAVLACGVVFAVFLIGLLGRTSQKVGNYKFTHLSSNLGCICGSAVWSPDGNAIVYANDVDGTKQLFLRYFSSPVSIQLTHEPRNLSPLAWLPDGTHVFIIESADTNDSDRNRLLSVATVGGDPEFIMPWTGVAAAVSSEGKVFATFTKGDSNEYGLQVSNPIGSPPKWYLPAPFATRSVEDQPGIKFMRDGKTILLTYDDDKDSFHSWLLPYPAGTKPPEPSRLRLPEIPMLLWSPMPDERHIVASLTEEEGSPAHLWMWDTESSERAQLTFGGAEELLPRVAPDGKRLVYFQSHRQLDLTTVSVEDGSATTFIHSGREESMASWSASKGRLVWVSTRNGPYQIWVREPGGLEHPAVTAADFPSATVKWFLNPAISPDGDRIIYEEADRSGFARLEQLLRDGYNVRQI